MDILDTGTDAQGRFLDSTTYGVNFLRDTSIDIESGKPTSNGLAHLESEEEDYSGVGMRVCFKVSLTQVTELWRSEFWSCITIQVDILTFSSYSDASYGWLLS